MKRTKATKVASVALAPLAMAASLAPVGGLAQEQTVNAVASGSDDSLWDGGQPAGGTGVDPGPETAPDVPGIPDQAGVADLTNVGQPAGGTGIDAGPSAPPDTPSGPGLADGGEPAGAIG